MQIRKALVKTLATFFCIGYLPFIPGTFGSLAGIGIFYLIKNSAPCYILLTCFLILLGYLVTGEAERIFRSKDARFIVIDEVSGMLLSLMFIPADIKLVVIAFFLFRILDTLKPYPAGRLQNAKGSIGIMSDDIIAGLYTNIMLQIIWRLVSFRTS